jgi:hypothetical protein
MPAVAQVNLNQPRYASTWEPTCVDLWTSSPCRLGEDQRVAECNSRTPRRSTGVLGMAGMKRHTAQIGDPLGATCPLRAKKISRKGATSGSDEAIVSDDPAGQHNQRVSQGPLDESVHGDFPATLRASATGESAWTWAPYKPRPSRRRLASTSRLKPYWGKPAVRNFRGGRENTMAEARLADA